MRKLVAIPPFLLILATLGVGGLRVLDVESGMVTTLVCAYIALCPGWACVHLLGLRNRLAEWSLSLCLSIALAAFVAVVMIYGEYWSPEVCFTILMGITALGAFLGLVMHDVGARGPRGEISAAPVPEDAM